MPGRGAEPGLREERPPGRCGARWCGLCVPDGGFVVPMLPVASLLPMVPVPPLGWWAVSSRPRRLRSASTEATITCKLLCLTCPPEVPVAAHTPSPHRLREFGPSRHRWRKCGFACKETQCLILWQTCRTPPLPGALPTDALHSPPGPWRRPSPTFESRATMRSEPINFLPLPNIREHEDKTQTTDNGADSGVASTHRVK